MHIVSPADTQRKFYKSAETQTKKTARQLGNVIDISET